MIMGMALRFYSLHSILEREIIGAQDEDRDALLKDLSNEENQ